MIWPFKRGTDRKCGRCKLRVQAVPGGARQQFKVNSDLWAQRCHMLRSESVQSPFECVFLRAAIHRKDHT
jgi:hypothetical protein